MCPAVVGGAAGKATSRTRRHTPPLTRRRSRAHQLAAGALVAEAAMRALRVSQLEICPWALREGVILRRLDTLDGTAQIDRSAQDASERLGRLTTFEARCTG